jgi:hypothetical protein
MDTLGPEIQSAQRYTRTRDTLGPEIHSDKGYSRPRDTLGPEVQLTNHSKKSIGRESYLLSASPGHGQHEANEVENEDENPGHEEVLGGSVGAASLTQLSQGSFDLILGDLRALVGPEGGKQRSNP